MPDRPSLRDRRHQETRTQISWAAVRLTVERGLRQVTIDGIAAEAGVSARTVAKATRRFGVFGRAAGPRRARSLVRRAVGDQLRSRVTARLILAPDGSRPSSVSSSRVEASKAARSSASCVSSNVDTG